MTSLKKTLARLTTHTLLQPGLIAPFSYLYSMTTITLHLPDDLEMDKQDTVQFIAAKLYEAGKLTLGQAGELSGLTTPAFAELLGDYGVSLLNYPVTDILRDADRIPDRNS